MFRKYPIVLVAMMASTAASAFERIEEYRIFGSEIQSVTTEPFENEAPARLVVTLGPDAETEQLTFESDFSIDDCEETLKSAAGDAYSYVQIRVHANADTMNGTVVTECARFFVPLP